MRRSAWIPLLLLPLLVAANPASGEEGPSITVLDEAAGRKAIVDETLEPYFKLLQPMEMAAKTGSPVPGETLEAQRDVCRKRYQDAVRAFTEEEKEALRWYVRKYVDRVHEAFPLFTKTPWRFIKLAPPAEGGLAHTRGRCIVLPPWVITRLVELRTSNPDGALHKLGQLLVHEQMHVVQRLHPARMASFLRREWKLLRPRKIDRPAWLVEHQVVNPDSVDTRWVLEFEDEGGTRWIQAEVIFREGKRRKRMPEDMRMVALELEKTEDGFAVKTKRNGKAVFEPLLTLEPFRKAFPGAYRPYHPYETMADLFTRIVIRDHVVMFDPESSPGLARYRPQFAKLLAE